MNAVKFLATVLAGVAVGAIAEEPVKRLIGKAKERLGVATPAAPDKSAPAAGSCACKH